MKKLILIISIFALPLATFAQLRVIAGPTAGYNSTWLLNPNMFVQGDHSPEPTFAWSKGVDAEVRLLKWLSFHTGFESAEIDQNFIVTDENDNEFNSNHNLKTTNIPLTLRLGTGFYFESGFTYSSIKKATWTLEGVETDVSDKFIDKNWMVTGGFGGNIVLKDKLMLNLGIQTKYGMRDNLGVDGWGRSYEDFTLFTDLYSQGIDITEIPGHEPYLEIIESTEGFVEDFDDIAKTYSLSVGAYVGVKWVF